MKQHLIFGLMVLLLLILMPLVSLSGQAQPLEEPQTQLRQEQGGEDNGSNSGGQIISSSGETIDVVRSVSGQTETIGMEEYLVGCVAAEMPANSHEEALKAQAVAAYTYTRYCLEVRGKTALNDTGASDQGYISRGERQEKWGSNFEAYETKITKAVSAVYGQYLAHNDAPIFAAYHAISGGKTESAQIYWGEPHAYLVSADSAGDKLSPGYSQTVTLSADEVKAALKAFPKLSLGDDPAKWFGKPTRSEAGTITAITVGGVPLSGREVREALALRSANFDVSCKEGKFTFTTYGYGHGVGMSQHGADFLARQGESYDEILAHYYAGSVLAGDSK